MKKLVFALVLSCSTLGLKAQYGSINAILDKLEERRVLNKDLSDVNMDDRKFVLVKDFPDHTERRYIILKGKQATYVEMFDDKQSSETSTNVFSGDVIRTGNNIISLRADMLEGKKIPLPVTKNLLLARQKKFLYLIDVNTKERWIEESAFTQK